MSSFNTLSPSPASSQVSAWCSSLNAIKQRLPLTLLSGSGTENLSGRPGCAKIISFFAEQNMEVKGATFLYTLATLMITFAGFSALLLASDLPPARGCHCSTDTWRKRSCLIFSY